MTCQTGSSSLSGSSEDPTILLDEKRLMASCIPRWCCPSTMGCWCKSNQPWKDRCNCRPKHVAVQTIAGTSTALRPNMKIYEVGLHCESDQLEVFQEVSHVLLGPIGPRYAWVSFGEALSTLRCPQSESWFGSVAQWRLGHIGESSSRFG